MNSELLRKDFPILETKVNGHQIVYFDNAATTQRPLPVVNAVLDYVTHDNGNPHRGAHISPFPHQKPMIHPRKWYGNLLTPKAPAKLFTPETPPNP